MKKKFSLLLILFCFTKLSFSQETKIDSLKNVIDNAEIDTVKLNAQIALSDMFLSINPDTALYWAVKAQTLGKKLGKKYEVQCYNNYGIAYFYRGEPSKGIEIWQQGFEIALSLNDLKKQADFKNNIAIGYSYLGETEKALSLYNDVIQISKRISYQDRITGAYNNMGILYNKLGLFKESIEKYYKVLETTTDSSIIADCYSNLAIDFAELDNKNKAEEYFLKAISIYKNTGNLLGEIRINANLVSFLNDTKQYKRAIEKGRKILVQAQKHAFVDLETQIEGDIGKAYSNLAEYSKAKFFLKDALSKNNNKRLRVIYYLLLADVYNKTKNSKVALSYNDTAKTIINELNLIKLKPNVNEIYSEIYEAKSDYEKALEFYKNFKIAKDTLFNINKAKLIESLNVRYETKKKEQKIKLQQKENLIQKAKLKQQKILIWFIVSVSVMVLILILVSMYLRSQKQKQKILKLQIEAQDYTKKEIASELHTGVGSELAAIVLQLENKYGNIEEIERIKKIYKNIRSASHILSLPDFIASTIEEEINNLVTNFKTEKLDVEVGIYSKTGWKNISPIIQQNIYRIVQELFTNTLKHAQASRIEIQLVRHSNFINLSYEDNGKGYNPQDIVQSKGYHDEIISRTKVLNGTYTDDSKVNVGANLTFKFPV